MTRIALIHALEESVAPARAAFAALWPEAFGFDLLDTSLAADRAQAGGLDDAMRARFRSLADYAAGSSGVGGRTAGILFTCSAFGPAIEAVQDAAAIPVLKPNEAAFDTALDQGDRLGIVVSFAPSQEALERELHDMAAARNRRITVVSALADGALGALKAGDGERHDTLAARAAASLGPVDAIILGQFSLFRARRTAERLSGRPIITTPESAVLALRRLTRPEGGDGGAGKRFCQLSCQDWRCGAEQPATGTIG